MAKDVTSLPCNNCGETGVVDDATYCQFINMTTTSYPNMITDKDTTLTAYATIDYDYKYDDFDFAKSMADAIEKMKPLTKDYKQAVLKTEFLKNRWSW